MIFARHKDPKFIVILHLRCMSQSFQKSLDEKYGLGDQVNRISLVELRSFLEKRDDFSDYYLFTIVRNPFDRIVSTYIYHFKGTIEKILNGHIKNMTPIIQEYCDFRNYGGYIKERAEQVKDNINFEKFIVFLSFRDFYLSDPHLKPFYIDCTNFNFELSVDGYFKLEYIENWWGDLSEKIGGLKKFHVNRRKNKVLDKEYNFHYSEFYSEEQKKVVENLYKKDLYLFNYEF